MKGLLSIYFVYIFSIVDKFDMYLNDISISSWIYEPLFLNSLNVIDPIWCFYCFIELFEFVWLLKYFHTMIFHFLLFKC